VLSLPFSKQTKREMLTALVLLQKDELIESKG